VPPRARGDLLRVGSVRPALSAGGGERFELGEGDEQLVGPWPAVLEVQLAESCGERQAGGDVQQPVARRTTALIGRVLEE
jgi:hypothetical protein